MNNLQKKIILGCVVYTMVNLGLIGLVLVQM